MNSRRSSRRNHSRNKNKVYQIGILIVILILILVFALLIGIRRRQVVPTDAEETSQTIEQILEWKGKKYVYNKDLINILFIGIDKADPLEESYIPGGAGQSDCLMLLSLDTKTNEGRILQINRNTMVDIDLYDEYGNKDVTQRAQITLQHAATRGGESGAWIVKKTVSKLLGDLYIDGYLVLDMAGIPEVNDALGGVNVQMHQDYTVIDPAFIQGETVHLEGMQAQRFVRYRDVDEFNSVQNRMERQVDYVTAMIDTMKQSGGTKLYDVLEPYFGSYIITNLDADQMNALAKYTYLTDQVDYVPGETVVGVHGYEEYNPDEEALMDLVVRNYYKEK